MQSHFIDVLDRSMGHWQISPNVSRWQTYFEDLKNAPSDSTILTLTRETKNWQKVMDFSRLIELTIDRPSQDQLEILPKLHSLKRLRISHTRTKSLDVVQRLDNLEELVLEYVSGIEQLDAIGALPNLTALHVENLRKVSDFSGLGNLTSLRHLSISGTLDMKQKVRSLAFLGPLQRLEALRLAHVNILSQDTECLPLDELPCLRKIEVASNVFALDIFAWIQSKIPHVDGAIRSPYQKYGGRREQVSDADVFARLPVDEVRKQAPKIEIDADGSRWRIMKHGAFLLGKGERTVLAAKATVDAKCAEHKTRYDALLRQYSK